MEWHLRSYLLELHMQCGQALEGVFGRVVLERKV